MTQSQILSALQLPVTQLFKGYCNKLASLLKLVQELEKIECFTISFAGVQGNIEMVNKMPVLKLENYPYKERFWEAERQQDNCREIYGQFEKWDEITVSFKNGSYKFPLPINNSIYNVFLGMAGKDTFEAKKEAVIINSITLPSQLLKSFDKAVKFISKDGLRPAMQQVCIACENYTIEVVATDAHKLYQSKKFECSQKERIELLVSESAAKKIAKFKPANDLTEIHILEGEKVMVEGEIFDLFTDNRFPSYQCVIPTYETSMTFEKDKFVANIKKVLPYANKCTGQVNFHLNGSISLHTQDVDFSFECDADMPYISKYFPDTDIAFNGKFLLDTMAIFKDKTVKMFTNGINTQGAIFTNDVDNVLVMPLMMND